MHKLFKVAVYLLVVSMSTNLLPQPIVIKGNSIDQGSAIATSLWDRLFGKKKRRGTTRSPFCSILPHPSDPDRLKTWRTRPLFIWKESAQPGAEKRWGRISVRKIEVFDAGKTLLWSKAVTPEQQTVLYAGATELVPGQRYFYQATYDRILEKANNGKPDTVPEMTKFIPFEILGNQEQEKIRADLEAMFSANKSMTAENSAIQRTLYYGERGYWADVVQEIFAVENPSPDLAAVIRKIQTDPECAIGQPEP